MGLLLDFNAGATRVLRRYLVEPDVAAFAAMDDAEFKRRFGDTPLSRAKRAGLVRNATAMRSNPHER